MKEGRVHIVGAGLAGLSTAVRLAEAGRDVVLYEAARAAGGRCRSYHDPTIDMVIDNGNHLLLSGNHTALDFLDRIGAGGTLQDPGQAIFQFADLKSGTRWTLRPSEGRMPWWLFDKRARVPETTFSDYLAVTRLFFAGQGATIGDAISCTGTLYDRLWHPVLLAGLNTDPREASAALAATMIKETLGAGGKACHPMVAAQGLSESFITPALRFLETRGVEVRYGARLRKLSLDAQSVLSLSIEGDDVALAPNDAVVLAVPPSVASDLLPGEQFPDEFRAIVNAHFKVAPPAGSQPILGVVNGLVEWLFAFDDRLSVTISGADRLIDTPRQELAERIWQDVAALTGIDGAMPPWQIVKEKRATFAATPAQNAKRPSAETRWSNLVLAGDWTQTGLPATIEGAVRSGYTAAMTIAKMDKDRSPSRQREHLQ